MNLPRDIGMLEASDFPNMASRALAEAQPFCPTASTLLQADLENICLRIPEPGHAFKATLIYSELPRYKDVPPFSMIVNH